MRALQVIDSLHWGGVQELQIMLAQAAQKSPISLSLISLRADEATPYRARLERLGVPVSTFPAGKLLDVKRILRLSRWMRRESIDLVHTHLTFANIVGALAARLAGLPLVATLHVRPELDARPLRRWLNGWVLRNLMYKVIAVGYSVAEAYSPLLKAKPLRVIPNAVQIYPPLSVGERNQIRSTLGCHQNELLLLSTGRLDPFKGYPDLLAVIAQLRKTSPALHLCIVGSGRLSAQLEAQIQSQGLGQQVHLLGAREDVPRLLAASDLYVSASHSEGMSISILEAMAAGLPVVATCAGDTPRFVLPETGIVTPIGDVHALAEGIARLANAPELRRSLGAQARVLVSRRYNAETWFEQIHDLYDDVLRGNK